MMEYKGYLGTVEFDSQAKIFHGDVINTRDIITFQGTTVKEIEKAFKDSIDDYISWCKEEGVKSENPYSTFTKKLADMRLPVTVTVILCCRPMRLGS